MRIPRVKANDDAGDDVVKANDDASYDVVKGLASHLVCVFLAVFTVMSLLSLLVN